MSLNNPLPDLRSQPSRSLSFVRFLNVTQRKVDVIWINYEGSRVKYKTLEPEEFCDVNTYAAHPWIFQDALTHQCLNANSRHVFEPGPWYEEYLPDLRSGKIQKQDLRPKRIVVNITSPLYSLKDSAMLAIVYCMRSPEQIQELEIPKQCQDELILLMKTLKRRYIA